MKSIGESRLHTHFPWATQVADEDKSGFITLSVDLNDDGDDDVVKIFEFSNIIIINVDRNHILRLSVKVLFSYSHFQKSRENP